MTLLVVLLVALIIVGAGLAWRLLRVVGASTVDGEGAVPLSRAADRVRPPVILGDMPTPDARNPTAEGTAPEPDAPGGRS